MIKIVLYFRRSEIRSKKMDATERKMKILNEFQAQREVKISHNCF